MAAVPDVPDGVCGEVRARGGVAHRLRSAGGVGDASPNTTIFEGRRALFGPKHPDTLETMRGLCHLKGQMGNRTCMQHLMEDELVPPGLSPRVALETVPVPISTRICCGPRIGWH